MGKLQDVISKIGSALTSDTAKNIGFSLGATTLAGMGGGTQGINALGSVVDTIQNKKKERDLAKVKENKRIMDEKLLQSKIDLNEQKLAGGVGGSSGLKSAIGKIKPTPMTGPQSLSGAVDDDALEKNKIAMQKKGVNTALNMLKETPELKGAGETAYKENRKPLVNELKNEGLYGPELEATYKELSRQIAPKFYQDMADMVNTGENPDNINYTPEEQSANLQENIMNTLYPTAGAMGGAAIGSAFGPIGTVGGGIIGGMLGSEGAKTIANYKTPQENPDADIISGASAMPSPLQRATSRELPDYAGLPSDFVGNIDPQQMNNVAAGNLPSSSMQAPVSQEDQYAMNLYDGLKRIGVNNIAEVENQLLNTADFKSMNPDMKNKVIFKLRELFS